MSNLLALLGFVANIMIVGIVCLGVPWALFTIARTRRTTDEILSVQREILRELRRGRNPALTDAKPPDGGANPPKQPLW